MDTLLADLLQVLRLERLDSDKFRGESRDPGHHRVFGGQVLGQALAAACLTVENRGVHSLHAYFLRAGDPDYPIDYEVDRSRDGTGFSSRRVVALQHGVQIFHMSASFQVREEGIDRQAAMPEVPPPESLPDMVSTLAELRAKGADRPELFMNSPRPFEFRLAVLTDPTDVPVKEPQMKIWFRALDRLPDDDLLHLSLLAYASDYYLLGTAGLDTRLAVSGKDLQMASIDHAMWFHRPARADEWLLYVIDSPTAISSRGFARGSIFSQDGRLVASTAQEGLVRRRRKAF
jgi:acyl-CoA thioesterase-2